MGEENKPQNSFVFIKGTISHPKISQILRIDVENEAELDIIRGDFGERRNFESREIIEAIYGQETVYQYSAGDFEDYQTLRNQGQTAGLRRNAGSNRGVSDGGRDQSGNLGSLQDKDQVTFSLKNVSKLDYETLVSKPDMKITPITYSQQSKLEKSRSEIVDTAVKNARMLGKENRNGNVVVHVKDIDTDIII